MQAWPPCLSNHRFLPCLPRKQPPSPFETDLAKETHSAVAPEDFMQETRRLQQRHWTWNGIMSPSLITVQYAVDGRGVGRGRDKGGGCGALFSFLSGERRDGGCASSASKLFGLVGRSVGRSVCTDEISCLCRKRRSFPPDREGGGGEGEGWPRPHSAGLPPCLPQSNLTSRLPPFPRPRHEHPTFHCFPQFSTRKIGE